MGASTPIMGYSIEYVGEHMDEMTYWEVGKGIEVHKTKEKVWTMKDEQENTKGEGMCSDWDCNMNRMPLGYPFGMVEVLDASFG